MFSIHSAHLDILSNNMTKLPYLFLIGLSFFALFGHSLGLSSSSRHPPSIQGRTIERTTVIIFHKPANVVTSHLAEDSRSTVYDEVQSMKGFVNNSDNISFQEATGIRRKLHAIGRLDADTTGLLLLTNDGGLVHHVTNKNSATHNSEGAISKTYQALIMGHHDDDSLQCMWEGVDIGKKYGGMTQPIDDLKILDHPNHKSTIVSLTISEGKNRQVRRMFHAIGSGVMKLKRTHVGKELNLDGLEEGQWRILSDDEVYSALYWESRLLEDSLSEKKQNQKPNSRHGGTPRKATQGKRRSIPKQRRSS
jgi:23S rRNA pseudouridine2605 synthase